MSGSPPVLFGEAAQTDGFVMKYGALIKFLDRERTNENSKVCCISYNQYLQDQRDRGEHTEAEQALHAHNE